jgi:hypothetical protein
MHASAVVRLRSTAPALTAVQRRPVLEGCTTAGTAKPAADMHDEWQSGERHDLSNGTPRHRHGIRSGAADVAWP